VKALTATRQQKRPTIVTAAGAMLATGGALFAGEVLLSAGKYFTDETTYETAAADGIVKNTGAYAAFGGSLHVVMTILGVFAGVALVLLAAFAAFGHNWARAVSWIFGAPILLWYGALASIHALGLLLSSSGTGNTDPPELARRFDEAWPPWLNILDVVLMILVAVLLLAALVCQTVPAADAYFRKERQDRL
jgi:uncharacterized membrane protein YgdD (TMEM256/DUF423 family)